MPRGAFMRRWGSDVYNPQKWISVGVYHAARQHSRGDVYIAAREGQRNNTIKSSEFIAACMITTQKWVVYRRLKKPRDLLNISQHAMFSVYHHYQNNTYSRPKQTCGAHIQQLKISSPWIWKGVSATLQSGRYTLSNSMEIYYLCISPSMAKHD